MPSLHLNVKSDSYEGNSRVTLIILPYFPDGFVIEVTSVLKFLKALKTGFTCPSARNKLVPTKVDR